MRVLVCGSRHFQNYQLLKNTLDAIHKENEITEIIQGEARGADRLSSDWAILNKIPERRFPANWDVYGRRAGPIRNHQMLKEGKPEMVVAFLAPNSRGTKHMVEIAQKANIPVNIINIGV